MTDDAIVMVCKRGKEDPSMKKIQLEIPERVLEGFKQRASGFQNGKYTPKQLMENVLTNTIDGISAT